MVTTGGTSLLTLQLWVAAGSVLIPLLVAVLSKSTLGSHVKAVMNLGLSALAAGIATVVGASGHIGSWSVFGTTLLTAWVASIVSYYGAWKPSTLAPRLTMATKNFGLGRPITPALPPPTAVSAPPASPAA